MARFDRYLLSQLLLVFGFFSLVLILIYWINRAVALFDRIIADGQSAGVFLELSVLALPGIIRLVLPLAAFFASVYVTNKLSSESELVVVQATGFSNWRLARPFLVFGLVVLVLESLLMHVLVPAAARQEAVRNAEIAQNLTARFLTEGRFESPTKGVTLYIREITPDGELLDVFLSDDRDPAESLIYTADRAFLVSTERGPQLVMVEGLAQTLRTADQRLFTTSFEDFAFDVSALIDPQTDPRPKPRELATPDLLWPTAETLELTRRSPGELVSEGHDRFAQALLAVVGALLGFSALIVGGFSRFGLLRNILFAVFLVLIVKTIESWALTETLQDPARWPAMYLPAALGIGTSALLIALSHRPALFRRRARATA